MLTTVAAVGGGIVAAGAMTNNPIVTVTATLIVERSIRCSRHLENRACLPSSFPSRSFPVFPPVAVVVVVAVVVAKVREPVTYEVKVRATVGARGLGLVLAEEKEGNQWVVKGFRPMPGGKPNPGQVTVSSYTACFFVCVVMRMYMCTLCVAVFRRLLLFGRLSRDF